MKKTTSTHLAFAIILLFFLQLYSAPLSQAQTKSLSKPQLLMEENNYTDAINYLEGKKKLSTQESYDLAICYLNTAEASKALTILLKIQSKSDKPNGYFYVLGSTYERCGRHVYAVANWHRFMRQHEHKLTPFEKNCITKKIDISLGKEKPQNIKEYQNINFTNWGLNLSEMLENNTATLSNERNVIVFSIEHSSDSTKNTDLFYAVKDKYGLWSKAKPFNTNVNTSDSEVKPVFMPNSSVLQFSRVEITNGDGIPSLYQTKFNPSDYSWESPLPLDVFVKKAD